MRIHKLTLENKFLPDLDLLRSQVDENTRMITVNNPDNPTGSWIPKETMMEIVKIAEEAGAFILSDEEMCIRDRMYKQRYSKIEQAARTAEEKRSERGNK